MKLFFWFYITVMTLLVPWVMHVFGGLYVNDPPAYPNATSGYRTKRSMQNEQTWAFAHEYCGTLMGHMGRVFFPVAILSMLMVWGKPIPAITIQGIVMVLLEIGLFGVLYLATERALKKKFWE